MKPSAKALVLDRDGTLIEHVPYLCDPRQVMLLPGVCEGLHLALDAGLLLFLHSNQSGVGRGYFSVDAVDQCNRRMLELLDLGPAPFSRICIAPEAPGQPSLYRKPSPLFAVEVMRDYHLAPHEMWYVGDRGSDLATAQAAGTCGVGVATGLEDLASELEEQGLGDFLIFPGFEQAIRHVLNL
jgi:D-glycero-D-manno-heptose 1,7-bisphosphate phosphatase